jgi:hypothetical protein
MTLQELLEHAHLDALGQLDEREQAAFEAAYTVAPLSVQAQIRREQARFATMEHLLPQVDPPAELRERVLSAVNAAMIAQNAGSDLGLRPARRVHRAWRAASIGLVTAMVFLGAAFVSVYSSYESMTRQFVNDSANAAFLERFERSYMGDVLFSASTQRVLFTANAGFNGKLAVWTDDKWDSSKLFCELPAVPGETYRLVAVDDDGNIMQTVQIIAADGHHKSLSISKLSTGMRLALVSSPTGEPIRDAKFLMEAAV